MAEAKLKQSLGPVLLWGIEVGLVISGMYFGWNLGLAEGGTGGLAITTLFIAIMYVTFTFSYPELACAIPKAGGEFDYADRALGKRMGFFGGMAQIIEFEFANLKQNALTPWLGWGFCRYSFCHLVLSSHRRRG